MFQSGGNCSGEEMALLLPNHRNRYTIYTHRGHKISIIFSWCDLLSLVLMAISTHVMCTQATMSLTSTHTHAHTHWPLFHRPFSEAVIMFCPNTHAYMHVHTPSV